MAGRKGVGGGIAAPGSCVGCEAMAVVRKAKDGWLRESRSRCSVGGELTVARDTGRTGGSAVAMGITTMED